MSSRQEGLSDLDLKAKHSLLIQRSNAGRG